jgi:hypothetical protein
MKKFIYDGFACIEANEDEIVFSNGRGEVRLELMELDCVPMKNYKFSFEECEDGEWKIVGFEKDKFDKFSVFMRRSPKGKVCVTMHLDSYKKEDMEYFKCGTKFNLKIE